MLDLSSLQAAFLGLVGSGLGVLLAAEPGPDGLTVDAALAPAVGVRAVASGARPAPAATGAACPTVATLAPGRDGRRRPVRPPPGESSMARHVISTPHAPRSPLFAQGVRAGDQIWVSGTTGLDPVTGRMAGGTVQEQTAQALASCVRVVEAGGGTVEDVVEVGVLLARPDDFAGLDEAWAQFFPDVRPTRYVARLGPELPGVLVSVRMTAVLGTSGGPRDAGSG